jgi:hypothetical protein
MPQNSTFQFGLPIYSTLEQKRNSFAELILQLVSVNIEQSINSHQVCMLFLRNNHFHSKLLKNFHCELCGCSHGQACRVQLNSHKLKFKSPVFIQPDKFNHSLTQFKIKYDCHEIIFELR